MHRNLQRLFDRCEAQRHRMLQRAASLNASRLTEQPGEGEWSLLQHLHHLVLTEQAMVRLASDPANVARLAQQVQRQDRRVPFFVVWLVLRCGIRVPVPVESVLPSTDQTLPAVTRDWKQAREQLRTLLTSVENIRQPFAVHPVCGALTPAQVLQFLLAHGHYHERPINRLYHAHRN